MGRKLIIDFDDENDTANITLWDNDDSIADPSMIAEGRDVLDSVSRQIEEGESLFKGNSIVFVRTWFN